MNRLPVTIVHVDGRRQYLFVFLASSVIEHLRGLIGRESLLPNEGLLIPHCRQIHTWFMTYPIDVVFFNRNNIVINITRTLRPFRCSPCPSDATHCLELPAKQAQKMNLALGDRLKHSQLLNAPLRRVS